MELPEHCLARLLAANLVVSPPGRGPYPDCILILKPRSNPDDHSPGMECHGERGIFITDDPMVWLYPYDDVWFVTVHEYAPGPGPGDFTDVWDTPDEAVTDLLDYLFGDPVRRTVMQPVEDRIQCRRSPYPKNGDKSRMR